MKKSYQGSCHCGAVRFSYQGEPIAAALGNSAVEATRKDYYCTAVDFRQALENDFSGPFSDIVFAVTDWSPERRYPGFFRDVAAA